MNPTSVWSGADCWSDEPLLRRTWSTCQPKHMYNAECQLPKLCRAPVMTIPWYTIGSHPRGRSRPRVLYLESRFTPELAFPNRALRAFEFRSLDSPDTELAQTQSLHRHRARTDTELAQIYLFPPLVWPPCRIGHLGETAPKIRKACPKIRKAVNFWGGNKYSLARQSSSE
jgi:hypothetical protein